MTWVWVATASAVVLIAIASLVPTCLVEGTLVDTPAGRRTVETLGVGDAVWTLNANGDRVAARVTARQAGLALRSRRLEVEGGHAITVTPSHPVATPSGWRAAGDLAVGELVSTAGGARPIVDFRDSIAPVRVYDIEVDPYQSFLAGGVLVHNKRIRVAANEAATLGQLREMGRAQAAYAALNHGHFAAVACLIEPGNCEPGHAKAVAPFLDAHFATELRMGYRFVFLAGPSPPESVSNHSPSGMTSFTYVAVPQQPGRSGRRGFCTDATGVLCATDDGALPPTRDGACIVTAPRRSGIKAWLASNDTPAGTCFRLD